MTGAVRRIGDTTPWRTAAVLSASLAVHAALLGPLALRGLGVVGPERIDDPVFFMPVELERRPLLPGERARARVSQNDAQRPRRPAPPVDAPSAARPATGVGPPPFPPAPRVTTIAPDRPLAPDGRAWRAEPETQDARIARALRDGPAGCRLMSGRLDPAEQARCDQAFAAADRAAPIAGTGDAGRDARMAAQGAFALAEYDRRRAPLKPNSAAQPCPPGPNPRDACAFAVQGRVWSNRDGWLPDLPRRQ